MSKIAVPSIDKIHIADDLYSAEIFIVFEIGNGVINSEESRKNPLKNKTESLNESEKNAVLFNILCDCQIIICRKIQQELAKNFKDAGIQVLKTLEENARKGIINTICR